MKKQLIFSAAMAGFLFASCSQDEPVASLQDAGKSAIGYSVTADKGSRSASWYETGLDINKIAVSAWLRGDSNTSANYQETNPNNSPYFLNDVLTRGTGANSGLFAYASDARYWPSNGELLDFFAVVDNPVPFSFRDVDGFPGLDWMEQMPIDKMPDVLYAYTPDQTKGNTLLAQKNVSFNFNHALAKVVVTAEVRNKNLRVYITDMEIHGITDKGKFQFPHKADEDGKIVDNGAKWIVSGDFTNLTSLLKFNDASNPVILDKSNVAKQTLVGEGHTGSIFNDLLVIPNSYSGRNASSQQTYILLKGYAYNISNSENGFNPEIDNLIFPKKNADNSITPANIIIPVEFNWGMGTINHYNIVFDCGNGGSTTEDPNTPAFMRIGYEVEVTDWITGETIETEYSKK